MFPEMGVYSPISSSHIYLLRACLSRMGFPIQLKSKEVKISKEKTSQMIVKEKLSERAVMKERRLDGCFLKREEEHQ